MYLAGWSRAEIQIEPRNYAMFGYGNWTQRAEGKRTALHARAVVVRDEEAGSLIFCCFDLGYVTPAMRTGVVERLQAQLGDEFDEASLVLTATHTHSGPGGCLHEVLYEVTTPGFLPDHLDAVVTAACTAIADAWATAAPTEVGLASQLLGADVEVAWNRSLVAYNRNPEVEQRADTETHLAIDRMMDVITFRRNGTVEAFISLFGVHATCLSNRLHLHDADNKGYAATHAEATLRSRGVPHAVAIFAQATAGDVSPHYQGPGDIAVRNKTRGDAEYAYAEENGRRQAEHALAILDGSGEVEITGPLDSVLTFIDFTTVEVDSRYTNGVEGAATSEPCHGVAFFEGTRVDGPGMPKFLGSVARRLAKRRQRQRLKSSDANERAHYERLYAAQGPKSILLEAGRKLILGWPVTKLPLPGFVDPLVGELKRQASIGAMNESPLVTTVLPLQVLVLGRVAIVCCPGEFTTTAGGRVKAAVHEVLLRRGVTHTLLTTYCNAYMGYVTTNEEYQEQCYEGGHTVFGQWTGAAFRQEFAQLAAQLLRRPEERTHDRTTRPAPVPEDELALRTNIPAPAR